MRKCCCCNVKTGAVILGLLNFIVPLLIIVPLAGYWSGTDIDGLDVLRDNQKVLEKVFEGRLFLHNQCALKLNFLFIRLPEKSLLDGRLSWRDHVQPESLVLQPCGAWYCLCWGHSSIQLLCCSGCML